MDNKSFILRLAIILFAITFTSTILLTLCNYITKDKIEALELKNAEEARQSVIADADFTKINIGDDILKKYTPVCGEFEVYRAEKDSEFVGYCISMTPSGYIDKINMIVGINPDLSYAGIKIVSMSETPGLGAKAGEKAFYTQFSDNKKGELKVVKNSSNPNENEINAVSGATITSKAVTSGANYALEIATKLLEKEAE